MDTEVAIQRVQHLFLRAADDAPAKDRRVYPSQWRPSEASESGTGVMNDAQKWAVALLRLHPKLRRFICGAAGGRLSSRIYVWPDDRPPRRSYDGEEQSVDVGAEFILDFTRTARRACSV